MKSRGNQAGFTMIEIMVAMVILVILVGAVYTCFVSVADTADIARTSADELRVQQQLWKHFTENIGAIHPNPNAEYALVGEDESGSFGDADTLRFVTQLPMSGAKALPGLVKKVEYHIDDPSVSEEGGFQTFAIDEAPTEEKEGVTLFITESPLVLFGEDEGGELFEAEDAGEDEIVWERELPVRSVNFQYYDGTAEEWVEEWNSDETAFLPWAIRVQVNLAKTEGQLAEEASMGVDPQEDFDLDVTVVLSAGASVLSEFRDPNHYRSSGDAAQEAGAEEN
jgi:prepilin-type N-terminal cleavage/methylation domain-containing protein